MDEEGLGATPADVEGRIAADFPEEQRAAVRQQLLRVDDAVPSHSIQRVKVAALIVAAGRLDLLADEVGIACVDYRDVLAHAFYSDR